MHRGWLYSSQPTHPSWLWRVLRHTWRRRRAGGRPEERRSSGNSRGNRIARAGAARSLARNYAERQYAFLLFGQCAAIAGGLAERRGRKSSGSRGRGRNDYAAMGAGSERAPTAVAATSPETAHRARVDTRFSDQTSPYSRVVTRTPSRRGHNKTSDPLTAARASWVYRLPAKHLIVEFPELVRAADFSRALRTLGQWLGIRMN